MLVELQYLQHEGPIVQKAQRDNPGQWQTWWWICFGGGVLFLPFVRLLKGRWSPARAKADAAAHHEAVRLELKALRQGPTKP